SSSPPAWAGETTRAWVDSRRRLRGTVSWKEGEREKRGKGEEESGEGMKAVFTARKRMSSAGRKASRPYNEPHPSNPGEANHGRQKDPDAGGRLCRGLRGDGALPGAVDGRAHRRCGLSEQEGRRQGAHCHPRFRGRPDLQREAGASLRAQRLLRRDQ